MNLQEVQQLKQQIDSTNERLIYCKSQIESAKKRQAEILAQYNCKNYEEFNQLIKNKELEMETLANAAKQYLATVTPIIQQVESVIGHIG